MFCIVPLIPLIWCGVGALIGGGTVIVITIWESKPPYEDPRAAYRNYVRAVEKNDYARYQWSVSDPIAEPEFTMRCDQRKKLNLAEISEGLGDVLADKDRTKGVSKALSPWTRKETQIHLKKVGNSWKVVDEL